MKNYKLEDLETYQLAIEFADEIWNLVLRWNFLAKDTVGKQIIRSSDSIAANIADGYGRFYYKENKQFCFYGRGSILETKTWIIKAHKRKLVSSELFSELIKKLEIIHLKLNTYMKFIGKNNK
jgi:four helix bundle protein